MAQAAHHKTPKGRNGTGDSVTLYFDRSDPAERRALEAARLLATKHGRRKQAIIALLEAIYACYEETGELMSASAISGALMGQGHTPARQALSISSNSMQIPNLQTNVTNNRSHNAKDLSTSSIRVTELDAKSSAQQVAKNFLSSMTGMMSDFIG